MAGRLIAFEYPSFRRLPGFGFCEPPTDPWESMELLWPGSPIQGPIRAPDYFVPHTLLGGYPWRYRVSKKDKKPEENKTEVKDGHVDETAKDFRVSVDVSQFKPEELTVRTTGNRIVIHGKHEEREDDLGFVQREFTRSFLLPDDVDPETVKSSLSADGFLSIHAPKKLALDSPSERVIPIARAEAETPNEGQEQEHNKSTE